MNADRLRQTLSDYRMFAIIMGGGQLLRVYPPKGETNIDMKLLEKAIQLSGEDISKLSIMGSFLENAILLFDN